MKNAAPAAPFSGFNKGTVAFYKGIAANNTQDWFNAHRAEYIRDVITPAQALVNALGPRLQKLSSKVGYSDDYNGRGSIKKIQTDRRFNPDRTPYKTYLDLMFWEGPAPVKKENPAFYLRLTEKQLGLVGGAFYFEKAMLKAWQTAVLDPQLGPELAAILDKLTGPRGKYKLGGETKKNVPRGLPADHQLAHLLKHEAVYVYEDAPHPPELFSAKLADYCMARFKDFLPLHQWLLKVYQKAYR